MIKSFIRLFVICFIINIFVAFLLGAFIAWDINYLNGVPFNSNIRIATIIIFIISFFEARWLN